MSHLVCTSFKTNSPLIALAAFAAAVETLATVGSILDARIHDPLPDNHDELFGSPEDGTGVFADIDIVAERLDGGQFMAHLSVTRREIDKEPGLLSSFYGGSSAGAIRLFCEVNPSGEMAYWVEARSAGSEDITHGPSQVLAWAQAASRRIHAANETMNNLGAFKCKPVSFQDEEDAGV